MVLTDGRDSSSDGGSGSRGGSSSSRGSTRCHRREPWEREERKEEARRGSGDGLARPVWEGLVMQEMCIYAGTYTEDYSLFYSKLRRL